MLIEKERERERDLGDEFVDGSVEEIGGVTGVPFAISVLEFELHEVTSDGSDEHVAGATIDGVTELEYLVVSRPTLPGSQAPIVPRQNGGHRLRHRRLLRHVQHLHAAAAPAAGHRFRLQTSEFDLEQMSSRVLIFAWMDFPASFMPK